MMDVQMWKQELPEFREKTAAFHTGEMSRAAYKGFSGYYGSYAQRDGSHMLRLRMTAGCVTKEKLKFLADVIRRYQVDKVHFTTCQTVQLHNLDQETVCAVIEEALDAGILTMGGGGDYPRNVMCSPLSGVEKEEYFDVRPWAIAAGEYLTGFIKAKKMPRKLKVCFSNSAQNLTHATFRDLGFAAREDGRFDVYSAGGLGNQPRLGVKVAEGVEPERILYYIKAMWLTFLAYGNYENRGKARTRFMQESLGGAEAYKQAYLDKLKEVTDSGEALDITVIPFQIDKKGDGSAAQGPRILEQKQEGLYTVVWHPLGGRPSVQALCELSDALEHMEAAELRLAPDETAYIVNLTGKEAEEVLEITADSARSLFESSVSCIGGSICQVGIRDSQALLAACIKAVREAGIPDGALPQIHISGCPSSCGTHQSAAIGFRGAAKMADGKPRSAYMLFAYGCQEQGKEAMGKELGTIFEERIPAFLTELGRAVAESGMDFAAWNRQNPTALEQQAAKYL